MTISLNLKDATGALFLNDSGKSSELNAPALQGFVSFPQSGEDSVRSLRLNCDAFLNEDQAGNPTYRLVLGCLAGSMALQTKKRLDTDPDYLGSIGIHEQLLVTGWIRIANGRQYILLNIRENAAYLRSRVASFI